MSISSADAWALARFDAHDQARLVRDRDVPPDALVEAALLRIRERDPALNAVSYRAEREARAALVTVSADAPMAGVPYLLKASLAYPGWPQTSCSRAKAHNVATTAYPLARAYDAAGLVPVGMSTMPEFGLLVSGEALLPGPTLNPWNERLSPGGSSTGAAVAVAAGLVPLAHASDAAGSIRVPAAHTGVVGFKPGRGANRRARAAHLLDDLLCSDALIARSVRDAAWAAEVGRPAGLDLPPAHPGPLRVAVMTDGLAGAADPAVAAAVERVAALLTAAGHSVEPVAFPFDREALADALATLWAYLGGEAADATLASNPGPAAPMLLEPWTLGLQAQRDRLPADALARALAALAHGAAAGTRLFAGHDLLLSPVTREPPLPLGTLAPTRSFDELAQAFFDHASFTPIQNITGDPSISLPLGATTDHVPLGVMLSAANGQDRQLFKIAGELEIAAPWTHVWPPNGSYHSS